MDAEISPKYLMKLIEEIENNLWDLFPTSKYFNVEKYIEKWQKFEYRTTDTGYNLGYVPHLT
jgi:ABC-type Zn uptake system ZnuABC Zn-binding protein ZnuA